MDVANQGIYIAFLYLRMNAVIYGAITLATQINQQCSSEGTQFVSLSLKGSLVVFILNILAIIYLKTKEKLQQMDIIILAFINLCWTLVVYQKMYQTAEYQPHECPFVILTQQVNFYSHLTTVIWVFFSFCFEQTITRITSLPLNGLSLYLLVVNQSQIECLPENIYFLFWLSFLVTIILGIPYNFFITVIEKRAKIKQPFLFLVIISILIQLPLIYLIYQYGLDYRSDACQGAYAAQRIHFLVVGLQLTFTTLYLVYYKQFEKVERPFTNARKPDPTALHNQSLSLTTKSTIAFKKQ